MTIASPKLVIIKNIPDSFFSYEEYDFVYGITQLIGTTSTARITYLDTNGETVEVYSREFLADTTARITDIGNIIEPYVKSGKREFTLSIASSNIRFSRVFNVDYMPPTLVVKKGVEEFTFSSALDRIVFAMVGTRADYSAKFELRQGEETILSENYVPDANNEIVIRDLSSLIEPYLQENLLSNFEIEIIATSDTDILGQSKMVFTALYCKADVDMPVVDFIANFFLSTLMGDKVTALGQKEYLHFCYTLSDKDVESGAHNFKTLVEIYPVFVDGQMNVVTSFRNWEVQLQMVARQIVTIDVSPLQFVEKGLTLISYKVVVGGRAQTFCVNQRFDSEPDIAFKNSFGLLETLYFIGTKEETPEISRSAAYIDGEYRNYHIEENRLVKAHTGVLPETMVCLVDELARSTEAYLIEKGEIGRQITITGSELKRTNELDSLFSFQITYRIAKRNQNILKVFRPSQTFDSTFDKTFQ